MGGRHDVGISMPERMENEVTSLPPGTHGRKSGERENAGGGASEKWGLPNISSEQQCVRAGALAG